MPWVMVRSETKKIAVVKNIETARMKFHAEVP
jgi:hypothetical protein